MPAQASKHPKTTIWLWPTGLFPRRIVYFLAAKHITASTLAAHNITIATVEMRPDPPFLFSKDGCETRPSNASLPVMRITHDDGQEFWIRESNGVMAYLEELFGSNKGYPDLRGATMGQRARTADIMSCLGEAGVMQMIYSIHTNPVTTSWSGLEEKDMSASAGAHAKRKFDGMMKKLESWIGEDVKKESKSLSGDGVEVTVADVALMSQVEYLKEMYGMSWVDEFEILKKWHAKQKEEKWVVPRELLVEVEKSGNWELVLGA